MQHVYYGIIFLTGCCSLIYQVVWQKYLHILVGGEARSTTIIVAIFLAGLSCGYYFFGRLSLRWAKRRVFLKFYGYVEIATGGYVLGFPRLFTWIEASGVANHPSLLGDVWVACLLIGVPTVLMGATIPVMTTVLPTRNARINRGHAVVYGMNTLGAFAGVLLAGFVLIAQFGLAQTLILTGSVNVICGLIYVMNRLNGEVSKRDTMPHVASRFAAGDVYVLACVSGVVSISLEILWIRLLGLTIGASFVVFPMVLSLFVLGLGIGSLTVKTVSTARLRRQFYLMLGCLTLTFFLVPYLPLWMSNIRVLLASHRVTYYLFYAIVYGVMAVCLLSFVIPMGTLLPMAYGFLDKDPAGYGWKCGILYFVNTVGTIVGAVVLSYLCLYIFSIETVYVLNIGMIVLTFSWLFVKDRTYRPVVVGGLILLIVGVSDGWDRRLHVKGLFRARTPTPYNFQGLFNLTPSLADQDLEILSLNDGPNSTVGVAQEPFRHPTGDVTDYRVIFVNGKSDSETRGDYMTLSLAAYLPYMHAAPADGLRAAVVGQGTGVTTGILAQFDDVTRVDLIEISRAVIDALPHFGPYTYDVHTHPKVSIHHRDAFKFFRAHGAPYDLIVSEPTNPWLVGVENLFTSYFYALAKARMHAGGILTQWIHTYAMDFTILNTIFTNLLQVFPYAEVYQGRNGDLLLVASAQPLQPHQDATRATEPMSRTIAQRLNFKDEQTYQLLRLFTTEQLHYITATLPHFEHSLQRPTLSRKALQAFFLGAHVDLPTMVDPYIVRMLREDQLAHRHQLFMQQVQYDDPQERECAAPHPEIYVDAFCQFITPHLRSYRHYQSHPLLQTRLQAYAGLRAAGLIPKDEVLLTQVYTAVTDTREVHTLPLFQALVEEYLREGEIDVATMLVQRAVESDRIRSNIPQLLFKRIQRIGHKQRAVKRALQQVFARNEDDRT